MQHFTTVNPGSTAGIPTDTATIAEVMANAGYDAHAIGKWHVGSSSPKQIPTGRGFLSYLGYLQGQTDYYNHSIPTCGPGMCLYRANCEKFAGDKRTCVETDPSPYGVGAAGYDLWQDSSPFIDAFGEYSVDKYQERFTQLVQNAELAKKPLFVYFAQQLLHLPLQLPPESKHAEACRGVTGGTEQVNRTVLCAMASRLDQAVGDVVDSLKAAGLWNNTVVWAISDNGGMVHFQDGFPASASSNWPLRGSKATLFEGGVRSVSFLFGGALPPQARGTQSSSLIHVSDVLPTIASGIAGIAEGDLPNNLDGFNVWEEVIMSGAVNARVASKRNEIPLNIAINRDLNFAGVPNPFVVNASQANYTALIRWPWKLILGTPHFVNPGLDKLGGWWTVENYTYIPPPGHDADELVFLFNLETDETEHENVAKDYPDVVANMTKRVYRRWLSKENGYRPPQLNIPRPRGNPKLHNWTWAPFVF
mmetsp:Transcript_27966/g.54374  ORF Transcript_27966/g.54374 Transcript_27966/m.54374 type:complete len:477 (-) Transcript_27966:183-1613(-)